MAKINKFDIEELASAFEAFETDSTKRDLARFKDFLKSKPKEFKDTNADELFKYYQDRTHTLDLGSTEILKLKKHPKLSRAFKSAIIPTSILTPVTFNLLGRFASDSMIYGSKFLGITVIGTGLGTGLTFATAGLVTLGVTTVVCAVAKEIAKNHQIKKAKKHAKELINGLEAGRDLKDIVVLEKLLNRLERKTKFLQKCDNSKFPNCFNIPLLFTRDGFLGFNGVRDDLHELSRFAVEIVKKVNAINSLAVAERLKPENVKAKAKYIEVLNKINTFIQNDVQQSKLFNMLKGNKKAHIRNIDIYATLDCCIEQLVNGYCIEDKDLKGTNTTAKENHSKLVVKDGKVTSLDALLTGNKTIDDLLKDLETKKSTVDDSTYKRIAEQILNSTIKTTAELNNALSAGASADLKSKVDALTGVDAYKVALKTAIDAGLITTETDLNAKADLLRNFDVTDLDPTSIKEIVKGIINGSIKDTNLDDETKKQKLLSALRKITGLDSSVVTTLENAINNGKISSTTDLNNKAQILIVLLNEKSNLDSSSYANLRDKVVNGAIASDADLKAEIQNILIIRIPSTGLDPYQRTALENDIKAGNTKSVASVILKVNLLKQLEVEHASITADSDFEKITDDIINNTISDSATLTSRIDAVRTKTRDELIASEKARVELVSDSNYANIFENYMKTNPTLLDVTGVADEFITQFGNASSKDPIVMPLFLCYISKKAKSPTDAYTSAESRFNDIITKYNNVKTTHPTYADKFKEYISKEENIDLDINDIGDRFVTYIDLVNAAKINNTRKNKIIKKIADGSLLKKDQPYVENVIKILETEEKSENILKELTSGGNILTAKMFIAIIKEKNLEGKVYDPDDVLIDAWFQALLLGDESSVEAQRINFMPPSSALNAKFDSSPKKAIFEMAKKIIEEFKNKPSTKTVIVSNIPDAIADAAKRPEWSGLVVKLCSKYIYIQKDGKEKRIDSSNADNTVKLDITEALEELRPTP